MSNSSVIVRSSLPYSTLQHIGRNHYSRVYGFRLSDPLGSKLDFGLGLSSFVRILDATLVTTRMMTVPGCSVLQAVKKLTGNPLPAYV